jgi:RimJ/RimL family protein N-acetyltransferase
METFEGRLVMLDAIDLETEAADFIKWFEDGEFFRLLDDRLAKIPTLESNRELLEKINQTGFLFGIRTRKEQRLIGFIALGEFNHPAHEAWVGIGIGDVAHRGKGYGTDAMDLILRFAFLELNLNRVSLDVFEYNTRGVRAYEKAGFKLEGRERESIFRDGKWWDTLFMGVLKKEWEQARS